MQLELRARGVKSGIARDCRCRKLLHLVRNLAVGTIGSVLHSSADPMVWKLKVIYVLEAWAEHLIATEMSKLSKINKDVQSSYSSKIDSSKG
jgi:hypothetical protein